MMPARLLELALFLVCLSAIASGRTAAAQTDVAANAYWTFGGATTGNNISETSNYTAGVMLELRHIAHPLAGYEATYSFHRDSLSYVSTVIPAATLLVTADVHEFAGDWVFAMKSGDLRPFAVVGAGVIVDVPTSATYSPCGITPTPHCNTVPNPPTSTSARPVFVYGGGIDCALSTHVGLRIQYRGNLAQAAELTSLIRSSGALTHTAEPMMGAYFRF
jgi:opacity protein-like surface antigen